MEAQREFTFDRAERMRILRAAGVPRAVANLIEAIEFSPPRPSWRLLAAKMRVERTTVYRALQKAEALGVIVVVPNANKSGRQEEHEYRIDWERLAAMPKEAPKRPPPRPKNPLLFGGLQNATSPLQNATGQLHFATVRTLQNATPIFPPSNNQTLTTTPTTLGGGAAVMVMLDEDALECENADAREDEDAMNQTSLFDPPQSPEQAAADAELWRKARTRLVQCGVGAVGKCLENAQRRGWSPAAVLAVCEHFLRHRGAWEAWVLFTRIRDFDPELPSDANWPDKSAAYLAEQRQEAAIEKQRTATRARTEAETRRIRDRDERLAREIRYGPALDSLDAEAFAAEVVKIAGGELLFKASGRKGALLRSLIFERWATEGVSCGG
jgi:hypothetical protein